jgi:hypothetical protein
MVIVVEKRCLNLKKWIKQVLLSTNENKFEKLIIFSLFDNKLSIFCLQYVWCNWWFDLKLIDFQLLIQ